MYMHVHISNCKYCTAYTGTYFIFYYFEGRNVFKRIWKWHLPVRLRVCGMLGWRGRWTAPLDKSSFFDSSLDCSVSDSSSSIGTASVSSNALARLPFFLKLGLPGNFPSWFINQPNGMQFVVIIFMISFLQSRSSCNSCSFSDSRCIPHNAPFLGVFFQSFCLVASRDLKPQKLSPICKDLLRTCRYCLYLLRSIMI